MALSSGDWRIEQVTLDDAPRLRLTCRGYLVGVGYFASIESLREALVRDSGPELATFEPESASDRPPGGCAGGD